MVHDQSYRIIRLWILVLFGLQQSGLTSCTTDLGQPVNNSSCDGGQVCVSTTTTPVILDLSAILLSDVTNPLHAYNPVVCNIKELVNADITQISSLNEDHSLLKSCGDKIHELFLARAISDILHKLQLDGATIIYTEQFKNHVNALQSRLSIGKFLVKFNTWQVVNRVGIAKVLGTINISEFAPAIVVLADTGTTVELLHMGRQMNLTFTDWIWIVTSPVDGFFFQPYMNFGDKVIFIDYSENNPIENKKLRNVYADIISYNLWDFSMSTEKMNHFGIWTLYYGVPEDILYLWDFTRFENKTFNITTIELPIFHYTVTKDGERKWEGICIEILNTLATVLNFNYTIIESIDNKWGAPTGNGSWNGMVGMVYRKEVEWGLAKFTVTSIRDSVIDYSVPFWHEPAVIVMKKPIGDSIFLYFGPFRWEVWFTLCLTIPFMGFFVALSVRIDYTRTKRHHPFYKQWYLSSWVCFGIMVQQGSKYDPQIQSSRLMLGFYWFFSIVAAATYTGNLIAVLAVPKTRLPVQTLQDLANQDKYLYGTMAGAAISTLIEHSTFDVYQTLWDRSMQYPQNNVKSHKMGLERVKSENYIYLGERAGVAPIVYSDCDYAVGKEEFFPSSMAFIFPDKSPLIPIFNKKIANMIETGMVERWRRMYHPLDQCSAVSPSSGDAATIKETQGGFILLCGCVSLAGVLLMLEFSYRKGHLDKYIKFERLKSFNMHK